MPPNRKIDNQRAQNQRLMETVAQIVRTPAFRAEAHRQSLAVSNCANAAEDQAFIDAISEQD